MASRKLTSSIAATVAVIAIGAGSYGIAAATSSSASATASTSPASTSPASTSPSPASTSPAGSSAAPGGGESNARSGPAAGGTTGTVSGVSTSGFTVKTATGQKATIKETSATTYQRGTSPASAGAITAGESVLVVGTTDSTTITATQVTVQPAGSGTEPSSAAQVVPFSRGTTSTSKQVGQIPADYQQGSGTIVSGTAANKATKAALAAYPGGIVDRVVQLANGQYEVHYIGVNWPHHIFVNQDFQVIGAD
jgi:membrane-bound inhibitor of C-type lysozyme